MAIWVIRDLDCYLPEGICYWHSGTPGPKSALESECGPAVWMQDAGVSGGGVHISQWFVFLLAIIASSLNCTLSILIDLPLRSFEEEKTLPRYLNEQ